MIDSETLELFLLYSDCITASILFMKLPQLTHILTHRKNVLYHHNSQYMMQQDMSVMHTSNDPIEYILLMYRSINIYIYITIYIQIFEAISVLYRFENLITYNSEMCESSHIILNNISIFDFKIQAVEKRHGVRSG